MSTTTTVTTKTLKTTAVAEPIKTTITIARTTARGQVTQAEADNLRPGTATMTTRTVTETKTTATCTTTTTFREGENGVSLFLMDISHAQRDIRRMEDSLIEHVKDTMCILETRSDKTIEKMYIGKTHCDVDKRKNKQFNRLNDEHWTLKGINDRWAKHQENPKVPSEGMVVLCAFTKHDLPVGSRRSQEHLALAMEQRLIHYFQIFDTKTIVVNEDFKPGKTTNHTKSTSHDTSSVLSDNSELDLTADNPIPPEPTYCAYVVYITYSYLPPEKKSPDLRQKPVENKQEKPKDEDDLDTDSREKEATSNASLTLYSTPLMSEMSIKPPSPSLSPLSTMKRDLLTALDDTQTKHRK